MKRFTIFIFLTLVLGVLCVIPSQGATLTISGDTTKIDDTTLYDNATADNAGGGSSIYAGKTNSGSIRRLLLRFNLSSIPSIATISSVTVTMNVTKFPSGGGASNNQVFHRVTSSWVEGTGIGGGGGGTVVTGAVSWSSRQYPTIPWTTQGGNFLASTSSISLVGSAVLGPITWTGAGLVSDVQGWVNGSISNNGWILIGEESVNATARVYGASEDAPNSPSIIVVYSTTTPTSVERIWKFYE